MFNNQKNRKEILSGSDDDLIFYRIAMVFIFNVFTLFEIRDDIKLPQQKDDGGVVLSFDDGRIAYFKIQEKKLNDEDFESLLNVLYFLKDKFGCSIDSYLLCFPDVEFDQFNGFDNGEISFNFSSLKDYDGDAIVEMLENKRKNKIKFTLLDHVCHFLLPFMGYKDKNEFLSKFHNYMVETMYDNADKQGIEVVRL